MNFPKQETGQEDKRTKHEAAPRRMRRNDGKNRPKMTRPKEFSLDDVSKMRELHTLGLSLAKIGKLFGVSRYHAQMATLAPSTQSLQPPGTSASGIAPTNDILRTRLGPHHLCATSCKNTYEASGS